jgi:outer membrane protein assembly factor BamD
MAHIQPAGNLWLNVQSIRYASLFDKLPHMLKLTRVFLIIFLMGLLAGCFSQPSLLEQLNLSEDELHQRIQEELDDQHYEVAAEGIQAMEARFPFGKYAEQSQLESIYIYYMQYDMEGSRAAAERFIRLHPQHPNVDYAYYMKGLSSFVEGQGLFERFMPTDLTKRDPGAARQSFADFSQLVSRYPDSIYAADARKRMIYLRNLLARYEVHVANYYFLRGAYLASANRGRYVVENFQRTPAVPDALAVMVQAYKLLGMDDLANDALNTLRSNYPTHPALDANGELVLNVKQERSWLNKITLGLLDPPAPLGFDTREEKR